ncbi:MAG: nitrophenyl compound nitroreductase subunit ArsF family protein [Candidatus Shapirobacteria bacterium]|jgi:hypothetical protein
MKKLFIIIPIFIILIFALVIFKPFEPKEKVIYIEPRPIPTVNTSLPSGSEKIEVFAFHATQRCLSCINVGQYTQEVITQKFANEFASGKIIFKEVNIDLSENQKLAKDYGVAGSALYVNTIKDDKENHEEDVTVWRLVTNEAQFKSYFEAKIKKLL